MKKTFKQSISSFDIDLEQYKHNNSDDDDMLLLKDMFWTILKPHERILFAIYIEMNYNTRKMAQHFNITWPTCKKYIQDIKNKLKDSI